MARSIEDKPEIRPYEGQLLTADGRGMNVEGRTTTKLKLGEVDDDIEALVVPEQRNQMVLRLRSMKEHKCCWNFGCDKLWTGSTEESEFPMRYVTPKLVPRKLPTVPPDPGGQTGLNSITDSQWYERPIQESLRRCGSTDEVPESLPGIYENQCVRVVQEVQTDWATNDEDDTSEVYPEVVSLEKALRRFTPTGKTETVARVNETSTNTDKDSETIRWNRTPAEIAKMQKEDEAIAHVFYWAGTSDETIDMPSLGTNLIPKEQAIQYGPEVRAYWSRWDELSIKDGILYKKWFQRDGSMPNLLTIVPVVRQKEILSQFDLMETGGGQLAAEKILTRIRKRFWWPTMRTDVERKANWCLSRAHQSTEGKQKLAAGQAPFDPGIRFTTVAVDILGPVTMATSTGAKHVLVLTDLFTMYAIAVPLVTTDSADMAREIMENWVLTFGVPNVLRTDKGKSFGGKLIQEMYRLLGIYKIQTPPYKPKVNESAGRLDEKITEVVLKYCVENPRPWDTTLPYLNFGYNTTINRITGATLFSMVHGQECLYPVDLFYAKPHDEPLIKNDFAEWLDEQFRDAHGSVREVLGMDQR